MAVVRIGVLEALLTMRDEFTPAFTRTISNIQAGAAKIDAVGKKIGDIGEGLTKLSAPLIAVGALSTKFALDLNEGMANVATLIPGNLKRVEELKLSVQNAAIAVGKSTNDLTGGLYQVISAFGETAQTATILEINAKAAAAGLSSTKEAIDLTSAVTKGYGDTSAEAVEKVASLAITTVKLGQTTFPELASSMGKVVPIASALGQSQQELFSVFATATGVTGSAAEVATQYRGVLAAILDPSEKLTKLTKQLGFESAQAMLQQKGLIGTLQTIVGSAEASKLPITEFIGSIEAVPLALALAGPQADQFADKLGAMNDASGALTEAFNEQTQGINKAGFGWQQLKQQMIVSAQRIGDSILPVLVKLGGQLKPVLDLVVRGVDLFAKLPAPIQSTAIVIAGVVAAAGPLLIIAGQLMTAWAAIIPVLPMVASGFAGVVTVLTGPVGIVLALGAVLLSVDSTRTAIFSLASDLSSHVTDAVKQIASNFSSWSDEVLILTDNLKPLVHTVGSDLLQLLGKIIQLSGLITQSAVMGVVETAKLIGKFVEWAGSSDVLARSLEGLVNILKSLIDWTNKTNSVFNPLIVNWRTVLGLSQQKIEAPKPTNTTQSNPWAGALDFTDLSSPLKDIMAQQASFAKLIGTGAAKSTAQVVKLTEDAAKGFASATNGLAKLRTELELQIDTNKAIVKAYGDIPPVVLSTTEIEINAINRKAELQKQYLQDVETFGKAAATSLKLLRTAAHDSEKAADSMGQAWAESVRNAASSWQKFNALMESNNELLIKNTEEFIKSAKKSWELFDELIAENNKVLIQNVEQGQALLTSVQVQVAGPYKAAVLNAELWFQGLIDDINKAEKEAAITGEQAARAIIAIETKLGDERIALASQNFQSITAGVGSMLGTLGDLFGGFFAKLSSMLQQVMSAYSSFSGAGSAMGMGAAGAAMLGAAGAFIAVMVIAYDLFKSHAESRRMRGYGNAAVVSRDDGTMGSYNYPAIEPRAFAASKAITAAIDSFVEALGGTISKLADIEVQVRNDGKYFQSFVEGEFVGRFESMEEAVSAGLLALFTHAQTEIRGLAALVAEGLAFLSTDSAGLRFQTIEEAHDFLSSLKEISELGMPQGAIGIQSTLQHLDKLWRVLTEVGQASDATAQGMSNLIGSEVMAFRAWSDSITGRQKTRKEELEDKKQEARIFESTKQLRIAELKLRVFELQQQAQTVRTRAEIVRAGAGVDNADIHAKAEYVKAKAMVAGYEIDVMNTWLQFVDQMIAALNQLIADLEAIPEIDVDKIKLPGKGSGNRESVRTFIDDKKFDLATRSMGDFAKQQADITRQYDEQIEKAGKDKKLREELLKLKEQELRLLAQEKKQSTVESFRSFLGLVTPFDEVRKTAEGLIKEIEDSPFGDARKATMIGRVMDELNNKLELLAQHTAVGIFNDLISGLESYGMKEGEFAEQRKLFAILEHQLKVAQYAAQIEMLRTEGLLTDAQMKALDDALNAFRNVDPTVGVGGKTGYDKSKNRELMAQRAEEAAKSLADELKRGAELFQKYKDQGLSPWHKALQDFNKDWDSIFKSMGRTPETLREFGLAFDRLKDQFTKGLREFYDSLKFGDLAALSIKDQFTNAQRQYNEIVARFRSTGDLSLADKVREAGQSLADLAGKMFGTSTEGYQKFKDQILGDVSKLLGIDGNTITGSVIGGPQWFTQSSQEQIQSAKDNTQQTVQATNNVTDMLDYRGRRQEELLQVAVDRLGAVVQELTHIKDGVYLLEDNEVGIG